MHWTHGLPSTSGEVVTIREVVPDDAVSLFDQLSQPAVSAHLSTPPPSIKAFAGFIGWSRAERAAGRSVCMGIVPRGCRYAVGVIQVRGLEPSFFVAEWGFALGPTYWSTGVFLEAANLAAAFSFGTLGVKRLEGRVAVANARAQAALQKLGAQPEAMLTKGFRKESHRETQLLWTLQADDWRQRPLPGPRLTADEARDRVAHAIHTSRSGASAADAATDQHADAEHYPFLIK